MRLLEGAKLNAAVDVFDCMLERLTRGGDFVRGEKVLNVFTAGVRAEGAGGTNKDASGVGCQLRVNLFPMRLDELPCLIAILLDLMAMASWIAES